MPVMDVAGGWYTSGTFWASAGVVVAVLADVAVVWVTLTAGFPRRLYFGLRAAAPLLAAPAGIRGDLELRHRGTALAARTSRARRTTTGSRSCLMSVPGSSRCSRSRPGPGSSRSLGSPLTGQ